MNNKNFVNYTKQKLIHQTVVKFRVERNLFEMEISVFGIFMIQMKSKKKIDHKKSETKTIETEAVEWIQMNMQL